jgi:hypothetical protein
MSRLGMEHNYPRRILNPVGEWQQRRRIETSRRNIAMFLTDAARQSVSCLTLYRLVGRWRFSLYLQAF